MKFIYLLFIIFLLTGCGRPPIDNNDKSTIREIKYGKEYCWYYIHGERTRLMKLRHNGYFIDSCGKYTVGDTIKIVKK